MVFLNGDELHELDDDGKRVRDGSFLLLFNAHYEPLDFVLPPMSFGKAWTVVVDTPPRSANGTRRSPRDPRLGSKRAR
jgi:glycogen operon protein